MATTTTNLGLTKPDEAEGYDVGVFNANADVIDNAVGALQRTLGDGTGGGLGEKVDAVKTDTDTIKSTIGTTADAEGSNTVFGQLKSLQTALNTANQNIATLLTQTKGVKTIFHFRVNGAINASATNAAVVNIPETINPEKSVLITNVGAASGNISAGGVYWTRSGRTLNIYAWQGYMVDCQLIEFY